MTDLWMAALFMIGSIAVGTLANFCFMKFYLLRQVKLYIDAELKLREEGGD